MLNDLGFKNAPIYIWNGRTKGGGGGKCNGSGIRACLHFPLLISLKICETAICNESLADLCEKKMSHSDTNGRCITFERATLPYNGVLFVRKDICGQIYVCH